MMASHNLWYRDQLYRIVEESLEVTFVICNAELSEFTVAKIFDIFNQILPTGFVLGTGYWPFFNSTKRQCLCICGRYGIDCRHYKNDTHWLDLEMITIDGTMPFYTKAFTFKLISSEIDIIPFTEAITGYNINMKLTLQNKKNERGRPRRAKDDNLNINPDQLTNVGICSRFMLQNEYYPALHAVMFQPSPFFHECYGRFFPRLRQTRTSTMNFHPQFNHGFYNISIENMPHYSLIIQYVNLPVHNIYAHVVTNANLAHRLLPKQHKITISKEVQTENIESMEVFKYNELLGNIKPLWNDSSSCDSIHNSTPKPENLMYGGTYSVTTLQDLLKEPEMTPWEFQRATRRRNRRKAQTNLATYEEQNKINSIEDTAQRNDTTLLPSVSYATALKSPKIEPTSDEPDFQWLDDQFPDLLKPMTIKQEKLDEQFDIAEEFINQEKDNDIKAKLNVGSTTF